MKKGTIIITFIGLFWASLALCSPAFHYDHASLVRVVDGDTVRIDVEVEAGLFQKNIPCRLLRINAPELNTVEGVVAKNALTAYLFGKTLRIDYDKPDSFGRWLIELYADGQNISDWLVSNGYAKYQSY